MKEVMIRLMLIILTAAVVIVISIAVANSDQETTYDRIVGTLVALETQIAPVNTPTPEPPNLEVPEHTVGVWKYCYWWWKKHPGWIFGGTHKYTVDCYTEPLYGVPCAVRIEYLTGSGEQMMRLELESTCDYTEPLEWLENVEE